jgi:hypothetical protein
MSLRDNLVVAVCAATVTQFPAFCQENAAYKNGAGAEIYAPVASSTGQGPNANRPAAAADPYSSTSRSNVEAEIRNSFAADTSASQDFSPAGQAAFDERVMIARYNRLVRALNEFMGAYKAGQIDLKKAKAVRKALHDLEKVEWFKSQDIATNVEK